MQREDAIDEEPRRAVRVYGSTASAAAASAARSSSRPRPVFALGDDRGARHELARLIDHKLEGLLVDRIRLGDRDDTVLDAEQPEDGEVLMGLRPRALSRVDDQQEEVDAGRARDHRAHETLVAGNVDEREPPAVGEVERRVAEVDRDPACLLLGQPVGVLAREGVHERRLAVVDVARCADGQRHRASIRPSSIVTGSKPPSVEQRSPLRLVALAAAGERQHQEVEPFGAVRLVPLREHRLEDQQTGVAGAAARMVRRIAVACASPQS